MADRWYRDGLRFECTQCGACCTGAPGYVWVTREESETLARLLDLHVDDFRRRFMRRVGNRYALIERANGDCIFWDRQIGCTVYRARPTQCRTYPFWPENLRSRRAWDEVESECPGSGKGKLYRLEQIERIRRGEGETGG